MESGRLSCQILQDSCYESLRSSKTKIRMQDFEKKILQEDALSCKVLWEFCKILHDQIFSGLEYKVAFKIYARF